MKPSSELLKSVQYATRKIGKAQCPVTLELWKEGEEFVVSHHCHLLEPVVVARHAGLEAAENAFTMTLWELEGEKE